MFEAVQNAMAKQLRIPAERVTPTSKIKDDLGADSLDVLQLLMTIEEDMGITIPDESLAGIVTVQDIVDFLEAHPNN